MRLSLLIKRIIQETSNSDACSFWGVTPAKEETIRDLIEG